MDDVALLNAQDANGPRGGFGPIARILRLTLVSLALIAALAPAATPPAVVPAPSSSQTPTGVAAGRQASNVVVITIEGMIDRFTALSVKRRITAAEEAQADAIVIDLDTPGGEVFAVLEITQAIKATTVPLTVAWINDEAYSGGAIIAISCQQIIMNNPAAFGDALIIQSGPGGTEALPDELRAKFLSPLLADVVDSARRNGYDEYLVQAFVTLGIELWLIRDTQTGRTLAVNEDEYKMLFEGDPPRSSPIAPSIGENSLSRQEFARNTGTGGPAEAPDPDVGADPLNPVVPADATPEQRETETPAGADDTVGDRSFSPAGRSVSDLAGEVELELDQPTSRPVIAASDAERYELVGYIQDGNGPLIVRNDNAGLLGFGGTIVRNDEDLKQHLGATNLRRLDTNWSETAARIMTSLPVRGLLIVVFLLGLFLEMTSPGLGIPGGVAMIALVGLLAPPMVVGMASWWEIAAIGVGMAFIAVELFVLPGFGVFGVVGILMLFAGLVGTFVREDPGGFFPGSAGAQRDLLYGVVTLLLSLVTSGIGMYFIGKHIETLPLFSRMILKNPEPGDHDSMLEAMKSEAVGANVGDEGVTTVPLRPAGRMSIGQGADERVFDVVADMGWIDAGARVRVVSIDGFRIAVEEIPTDSEGASESPGEENA